MSVLDSLLHDSEQVKKKLQIVQQMYNERSKHEQRWQDLSKFIFPSRGRIREERGGKEGQRRDNYLLNAYPSDAVLKCAAGLHSGLTSPSRQWFELSLHDKEKAEFHTVRMWLNQVRDIMSGLYARSNTYKMLYEMEAEMSQFGTGAAIMLEDYNTGIWHRSYTCGEYAGMSDARGRIIAFARKFSLTAPQMVAEFGKENVSQNVRNAYSNNNITTRFGVTMLIQKNPDYVPDEVRIGNFAWRSFYIEDGTKDTFLRVSGYHECPFLMGRWLVVANEDYGVGPGDIALGDCMQLQKLEKNKLRIVDHESDPAMIAPVNFKGLNTLPGHVNYVSEQGAPQVYPLIPPGAKRYDALAMLIQEKQARISAAFYNDLMAMLTTAQNNPQMTAREIAERHEEKLLLLGPVLEQFHNEILEPLTLRTFGICKRNELLPPMPEEITEDELKVSFVSLLAQAQQAVDMPGMERILALAGNLAGAKPEILDNINFDAVIRKAAVINGTPEEILNSENDVKKMREQRAQAQAQEAQMQQMAAAAGPAKDMAQAARLLSETQSNGTGSVLNDMMGGL